MILLILFTWSVALHRIIYWIVMFLPTTTMLIVVIHMMISNTSLIIIDNMITITLNLLWAIAICRTALRPGRI